MSEITEHDNINLVDVPESHFEATIMSFIIDTWLQF